MAGVAESPEYRSDWPVSFYDRVRQNDRNTVLAFLAFGLSNAFVFATYGALAAVIFLGATWIVDEPFLVEARLDPWLLAGPCTLMGILLGLALTAWLAARSLRGGGMGLLELAGARMAVGSDPGVRRFRGAVEGLSIAAGIPYAEGWVMDSPAMNAFSTCGRHGRGRIVVTTALLDGLSAAEMEGVVAHEVAHIASHDSSLMMAVAALSAAVLLPAEIFARQPSHSSFSTDRDYELSLTFLARTVPVALAGGILWVAVKYAAMLTSLVARGLIGREREYRADADAARLSRNPDALAEALHAIAGSSQDGIPSRCDRMDVLFLYPTVTPGRRGEAIFNTHPPVDERIRRLVAM